MDLIVGVFRRIFGSQDERHDDNDDHNVRNRNPVHENLRANTTTAPNFPRARVTPSVPFYQPNVGDSPTTNPQHSQRKPLERTNDLHQNSTSLSSPLPPTYPYRPPQSSSKPPQYYSTPSPSSSKSATSSSKPPPSFPNALSSSSKPHQSISKLSPASSSLKDPTYSSKSFASSSNLPPSSFSPSSKSSVSSPNTPNPPPDSSPTYSKPHPSSPSLAPSSSKPLQSSPKPVSSHKPSLSSPKGLPSSSKPHQSISKLSPASSSLKDPTYSSKSFASSSNLSPSSFSPSSKSSVSSPNTPNPPPDSSPTYSKPHPSSPSLAPSSSKPLQSSPKPVSSHKPSLSSPKGFPSSSGPSAFPHNGTPPSPSQTPAFKPILYMAPSDVVNEESKMSYVLGKGTSPIYPIPEDIKGLIKKDIVPLVLKQPLSPSTYKRYFAALLYAEDYYLEKWSNFQLKNVILELHEAEIIKRSNQHKYYNRSVEKDDKIFVVFEFDSIPEKRPFLLSRDLVYARPSGKNVEPFRGVISRVVKSTRVLVEFGDDFHSQHRSTGKYDISFSFNRVSLKWAHQAVEAASDPLFQNFLFPDCISRENILNPPPQFPAYQSLGIDEFAAVHHILSFRGSPPYLLGGSLSVTRAGNSVTEETRSVSRTGVVVREAVFEAYKNSPDNRILVCAPINSTCDVLNRSLKEKIPESDMFRVNAAFREIDGVPTDILSSCPIEGECFACPSRQQLLRFRIILSTFVSSFRLHNEGIAAGYFSHIFLVDASSATEPEVMVALANFADNNTAVIVTGAPRDHSGWVRSEVSRKYGLSKSYFERLLELKPYRSTDPKFITKLDDFDRLIVR